ncbi:hypothetical protein B2A_14176 [mine drainage metagenome]|uniref:Uncharacterized protein n=1 Tax=mine drainage metagenome TaxID=410659 RepID=T0ZKG4_9ZZZZ
MTNPDISAVLPDTERSDSSCRDVVLEGCLRQALVRLDSDLPAEILEDSYRKMILADEPSLMGLPPSVIRCIAFRYSSGHMLSSSPGALPHLQTHIDPVIERTC